jgi:hypothetical protein
MYSYSLSIYLSIYLWLYSPLLRLGRFFVILIFYRVCRTSWTGDQLFARQLPAHRTTQTHTKRTQTSTPQVGFQLTIPVIERVRTVHDIDRAATAISTPTFTICRTDIPRAFCLCHVVITAIHLTLNFVLMFTLPQFYSEYVVM